MVIKEHSKDKGVLTLVPLPKIHVINARHNGSYIYFTADMRSDCHHIELSRMSQYKSAFVTPMGEFEYIHVPF